ncbi:dehydrogenase with different specificitie [Mariannaea sp. PMI_226]|nr:dehydrogenase with different specificitie [Mariannaea sp. PMI_226]
MSRYAAAHENPQGPGDSRPTALQIVKDNDMEGNLVGKVAVITGVSSGIGVETVRALEVTGAKLFVTARDLTKARAALSDIWKEDRMELVHMDQTSLESVRTAAKAILAKTDTISLLVNNAGVMAVPNLQLTQDGFEMHFATNHLAHFLFFQLLKPALLKATTPSFQSRVVMVSAAAHRVSGIGASDDYNYQKGGYEPWMAYARSKTANIYMANEIERRYGSQGLHATSLHPGIIGTDLGRHLAPEFIDGMRVQYASIAKSPEQGAATTIAAAIGKEWEGRGGVYLNDCQEAERGEYDGVVSNVSYVPHTYDEKEEARLWKDSLKFVGLADDN